MKVAIIGCGSIAKYRHAPEYSANKHISKIIFYDRNLNRAKELANVFDGEYVEDLDEILKDETITAVSDCTSNEYHHIYTTAALKAGKHVLCEKPIALTIEDAKIMLDAEKISGKHLMVGHNQRFMQAHRKVKNVIKNKELGKVLTFKTTFGHEGPENWGVTKSKATWFFKKSRSGLGVAGDLGIHKIDLIQYLLDDKITEVASFSDTLHKTNEEGAKIQVCDNMIGILKTNKNVLGTCAFSWTYYGEEDNSTIIYCEEGIIKIYHDRDYQVKIIKHNKEIELYQLESIQTNDKQTNSGVIDSFIDCIRTESKMPVSGEEALSSLKIILAMLESQTKRKTIEIN